mmetsp:Transcript_25027/g.45319  ORF Transcript_25027/g.45319 Transcript_25027/m.45319 type:complete len:567 (-) Transcript_25027:93-1793(-)
MDFNAFTSQVAASAMAAAESAADAVNQLPTLDDLAEENNEAQPPGAISDESKRETVLPSRSSGSSPPSRNVSRQNSATFSLVSTPPRALPGTPSVSRAEPTSSMSSSMSSHQPSPRQAEFSIIPHEWEDSQPKTSIVDQEGDSAMDAFWQSPPPMQWSLLDGVLPDMKNSLTDPSSYLSAMRPPSASTASINMQTDVGGGNASTEMRYAQVHKKQNESFTPLLSVVAALMQESEPSPSELIRKKEAKERAEQLILKAQMKAAGLSKTHDGDDDLDEESDRAVNEQGRSATGTNQIKAAFPLLGEFSDSDDSDSSESDIEIGMKTNSRKIEEKPVPTAANSLKDNGTKNNVSDSTYVAAETEKKPTRKKEKKKNPHRFMSDLDRRLSSLPLEDAIEVTARNPDEEMVILKTPKSIASQATHTSISSKSPFVSFFNDVASPGLQSLSENIASRLNVHEPIGITRNPQKGGFFTRINSNRFNMIDTTVSSSTNHDHHSNVVVSDALLADEELAALSRMRRDAFQNSDLVIVIRAYAERNRQFIFIGFTMLLATLVYYYTRHRGSQDDVT